jgi:hypothetical protein
MVLHWEHILQLTEHALPGHNEYGVHSFWVLEGTFKALNVMILMIRIIIVIVIVVIRFKDPKRAM